MADQNQGDDVGLSHGTLLIGGDAAGATRLKAELGLFWPTRRISGIGAATNTSNPPLDMPTELFGDWTYMTVMPNETSILLVLTGYPRVTWPPGGGIGPVILPNVEVRAVLDEDWKGTANWRYSTDGTDWVSIDDAPAELDS